MKKRTLNIFIFSLLILMAFNLISATSYSFKYKLAPENSELNWYFVNRGNDQIPECPKESAEFLDTYDAYYVGDTENKIIYLTFDEGYENGYTAKILDTLKEKKCSAVFFVTMPYVKQNSELVRRMIDEGHIVGNHSVNHKSMPTLSTEEAAQEIIGLHNYVKENFGYEMTLFRPPMGEWSTRTLEIANRLHYKTILWSYAYLDYDVNNQMGVDKAFPKVTGAAHNGAVYLLHAVSKDNAQMLGDVIDAFRADGYTLKGLS